MNSLFIKIFILSCGLSVVACNGNSSSTIDSSLTYDYVENGCDTQKQSFSSYSDLCKGLENSSLNHGCAIDLRQQAFSQQCPGQTFSSF